MDAEAYEFFINVNGFSGVVSDRSEYLQTEEREERQNLRSLLKSQSTEITKLNFLSMRKSQTPESPNRTGKSQINVLGVGKKSKQDQLSSEISQGQIFEENFESNESRVSSDEFDDFYKAYQPKPLDGEGPVD